MLALRHVVLRMSLSTMLMTYLHAHRLTAPNMITWKNIPNVSLVSGWARVVDDDGKLYRGATSGR